MTEYVIYAARTANIQNTPRLNRSIVAFLFVILSRRVRHAPFTLQMFGKNRQSRCGHKFSVHAAIVEQMPARHKKSPNERSKRPITTRRACRTTKCSHCLQHPSNDRTYPKHTRCDGHTNMSCYSSDIWQLPYGWTKKQFSYAFSVIFINIYSGQFSMKLSIKFDYSSISCLAVLWCCGECGLQHGRRGWKSVHCKRLYTALPNIYQYPQSQSQIIIIISSSIGSRARRIQNTRAFARLKQKERQQQQQKPNPG